MYFDFVFFHTILTVAQNTLRGNLTIIPECYSFSLVVFPICACPGVSFQHPQTNRTKFYHHPIELSILKLLFWSKLDRYSEYTDNVSLFGFITLALITHTCI